MNNCQMIHETAIKDIIDIINDIKDFDEIEWINNKNTNSSMIGSIAKRASNLVLVFPVLVSNSLSIQTASIISKAIERKCVALLQILFASINLTNAENLYDYISQFHSNLNKQLTLDDFMDAVDKLSESGDIEIINRDAYEAVKEDMHNIDYYLNDSFNPTAITEFVCKSDMYGNSHIIQEAPTPNGTPTISDNDEFLVNARTIRRLSRDSYRYGINTGRRAERNTPTMKDTVDYFRYQLLPQDVQKANELMPTLLAVNFTTTLDGGNTHLQQGIIGVKAKLYPIDSMDIVSRLSSKYSDKNTLFNFVKASTREISFFKDFLFALDKAKLDAINITRDSNNAKIFKLLERRATKYKFSALLKKNDASPITTLVISKDEVEYLKKYNNIDMEKSRICKPIMEAYNLMCITIADESLEIARFLYDDGDGIFESMSFDSLEKEAKDSSYKKVVNLMSKFNR